MRTLVALLALSAPAFAQDLATAGQVRTVSHEAAVEIHDRVAATTVTQIFENQTGREAEGTYTFAIPPGAAIVEFQMWINGRIMQGEMIDRKRAEEVYRTIVDRKKDPGILDHVRDNVWRVRVFPIPAQGEMKFLTRYVEVLPSPAGQVTYTLPFSIPEERAQKMDQFSLSVSVHASAAVTKIDSGGLSVVKKSPTEFVAKGDRANVAFQKDFVLKYEARPEGQEMTFAAHRVGRDGYFLLSASPDLANASVDRIAREVVYLVDASASMDEKLFRRLIGSIAESFKELGPKDRFNVVAFNSDVAKFQKASVESSAANFKAAAMFLERMRPQGRTDLEKALLAVASEKPTSPRMVFVISDGSASAGTLDGRDIVRDVLKNLDPDTVLYGVQVGGTTERTLEALARRTGGECCAADENGLEKVLHSAFKRFSKPILTNVRLDFGDANVYQVHAPRLLFADEPLLVAGRYRTSGSHEVVLKGRVGDKEVRIARTFDFPEHHEGWSAAAYVWAGRQIGSLLDEVYLTGETETLRNVIVALSHEHRIVTPYTSFLVLENDQMYAQYGLERSIIENRPLFAPPKQGKAPKNGDGKLGLPEPAIKIVDPLQATADTSLLEALRWLADNRKAFGPFKEGEFVLTSTGVTALSLQALEVSDAYAMTDEDRKKFEEAVRDMLATLKSAQDRSGRIGETLYDHVFAAEALARLVRWHPDLAGTRAMLQKAISYLSDQPGLLEKRGPAALSAPVIVLAKDLKIEVDLSTIKTLEKSVDGAQDVLYLRAQMALDPYLAKDDRVISAARRVADKGPSDPVIALLGTEALFAWRGGTSMEWKGWQKKLENLRRSPVTHPAGGYPSAGVKKDESKAALTALRALAMEEANVSLQK